MTVKSIALIVLFFNTTVVLSQPTENRLVHGYVTDNESRLPLAGVTVVLLSQPGLTVLTDTNGYFKLEKLTAGRHSFRFSMAGYETYDVTEVEIIAGRALELTVSLKEKFIALDEVVVRGARSPFRPNEFATVSHRSFSVDEIRRFSTSVADPARMLTNFPGVSASSDNQNSIVVRGNSPKGILWRLEGIEIPNPNHFSTLGTSGGAISMLNANTLASADFYTGGFTPEFGNALSGVFDIYLRKGNTQRREYTLQVSALGLEAATEGPFKKGGQSSYLISYRYSTFSIIRDFIDLGDGTPGYQDMTVKLNFPVKKLGTFTVFGLGGITKEKKDALPDSTQWRKSRNNFGFLRRTFTGVAGISHQLTLPGQSFIKTTLSLSAENVREDVDTLNPNDAYRRNLVEYTRFLNPVLRVSSLYNRKINSRHTIRTGVILQRLGYELNYRYYDGNQLNWVSVLDGKGNTWFTQAYFQWKYRWSENIETTSGMHLSWFRLTGKIAMEPRVSFLYKVSKHKFSLAAGWHSKPEHISTHLFQQVTGGQPLTFPNKNLDLLRAFHITAGFETKAFNKLNIKTEIYFQHLYRIPVESDSARGFSILNADNVFSLLDVEKPLVSRGNGRNYGIDVVVEWPLANGNYFIGSGSLFKSTYTTFSGARYNSRFNRNYQFNILAGKEFNLSSPGKSLIGINARGLYSGGLRETPIDIPRSVLNGRAEYVEGQFFTRRVPAYFRVDGSLYFKLNRKTATHTVEVAAQNLTNRRNYAVSFFDVQNGTTGNTTQLGIIPYLSYRIEFHGK